MRYCGLFVGITTLDLIYGVSHIPQSNEKQTATALAIAAGGPATNAAVTFQHLGDRAKLLSVLGQHPITDLVRADLDAGQVEMRDLAPERVDPPPLSSILVTEGTGDRAVVSRNAVHLQATVSQIPPNLLEGVDIVLVDGHQLEVSVAIAQAAQQQKIPVVLDGGSWKPGLERVLPFVTYAVCSANFLPPGCVGRAEGVAYLRNAMMTSAAIAITQGGAPIAYFTSARSGEIAVPQIQPVDTLGAGDIFHGAFCHWILRADFAIALTQAAGVAALSCQSFGTRQWLQSL